MANNKNDLDNVTKIVTAVSGVVAALAVPVIEKVTENMNGHKDSSSVEPDNTIKVPELGSKDFSIDVEQALTILSDSSLKGVKSKLQIKDARVKYRDCYDGQVLYSNPKQGTPVKSGSTVYVKYITAEVINESKRIFEEQERQRAEAKEKRTIRNQEIRDGIKANAVGLADGAKNGVKRIFIKQKGNDDEQEE